MSLPNWFGLSKTATDPQTIGEAIAAAIDDHNADSAAHMSTDEAIENHRDNEVIDHPAESVVNDKIEANARQYVAIVDPAATENFDTIQAAIAYSTSVGGGSIYVVPGTHYLSTNVELPTNIYIVGSSALTTIISCGYDSGEYFELDSDTISAGAICGFENIVFDNLSGGVVDDIATGNNPSDLFRVINCLNLNHQQLIRKCNLKLLMTGCTMFISDKPLVKVRDSADVSDCLFNGLATSDNCVVVTKNDGVTQTMSFKITNNIMVGGDQVPNNYFGGITFNKSRIRDNDMYWWQANNDGFVASTISGNLLDIWDTDYLLITSDRNFIQNNRITGGTGNRLRLASGADNNIVTGNNVGTAITNSGSNNLVDANITT